MFKLFFISLALLSFSFSPTIQAQSSKSLTFQFAMSKTKTNKETNFYLSTSWAWNDSFPLVIIDVNKQIKDERDAIRTTTMYIINCYTNNSNSVLVVFDRKKILVPKYNKDTPDKRDRYQLDFNYMSCKAQKCQEYNLKMQNSKEKPFTTAESKKMVSEAIKELKQGSSNPIFKHYDSKGLKKESCCDKISLDNYLFTVDYSEK